MIKKKGMDPEVPGLELNENFIEEDLLYNPKCPCKTRTCCQHGFCKLCVEHHREIGARLAHNPNDNIPEGCYKQDHGKPVCYRIPNEKRAKLRNYIDGDYED